MKANKILTLCLLVFAAQTCAAQKLGLGVKGGGNLTYSNRPDMDSRKSYGFNFGGFASVNFTKNIGVQLEAQYVRSRLRSDSFSPTAPWYSEKGYTKLHYLAMPVLLKIDVVDFVSVVGGPQFNFLRNSSTYNLSNGSAIIGSRLGTSYTVGLDLGPLYFRHNWGRSGFKSIDLNNSHRNVQYEVGFRVQLM
ncbi:porin family protein [Pedobacter mucosus]|uniref:porin family protein n=1 Tax=Pedobacter mucosus TaxID=2895286 RepID=UPI001EE487FF|nr:porin family protein [Pedobacter mucosus]UKT65039.1 PorT family protein [Pedobacter mucosus]